MKPVNLDENSLNDVPVGDTYAVRFTLDAVFDNEGQYPRRNLKFTDGGGDDRTITIWKNSAPAEIYDADYDRGATYLITAVEYEGVIEQFSHPDDTASWIVSTFVVGDCDDETQGECKKHLCSCMDAASGVGAPEAAVLD